MTARTAIGTDDTAGWSACWCCGRDRPEAGLLRLGARPEAAICLDCVPHLRQRARAHEDPPALVRHLHASGNRVREIVVATGIHNKPLIGPTLRWVNRRSPF